jgi:zinc transport system substrate-binding protein
MLRLIFTLFMILGAQTAFAEVPRVVADIRPVQALVARVMAGLTIPSLLVQPGYDLKSYQLRASDYGKLDRADLVFWVGHALTPGLSTQISRRKDDLISVSLLKVRHTRLLRYRSSEMFRDSSHVEHLLVPGVNISTDSAHRDHLMHDDSDAEVVIDPHAWLDPSNAKLWVDEIAIALSRFDPENAEVYLANAWHAKTEIDYEITKARKILRPLSRTPFIVYRDRYHYFEAFFDIRAVDAIYLQGQFRTNRSAEVRNVLTRSDISCAFIDPKFDISQLQDVVRGTNAQLAFLDPLGVYLPSGPSFYPLLLRSLAEDFAHCLKP